MEFDIGTIIYILIMIIAIAVGAFGKKKKQPVQRTETAAENEKKGFFSRLEQQIDGLVEETKGSFEKNITNLIPGASDFTGNEKVISEKVLYESFKGNDDGRSVSLYEDEESEEGEGDYDPDEAESAELVISESTAIAEEKLIQVIETEEVLQVDFYELVKEFNLAKAVIYSEIINRKEY